MKFDKRIERIYLREQAADVEDLLIKEIKAFPKEHRLLVAARATFIKWKLIFQEKLDGVIHVDEPCGLCVRKGYLAPKCFDCPGEDYCVLRLDKSAQDLMMEAYKIYMNEHRKFV